MCGPVATRRRRCGGRVASSRSATARIDSSVVRLWSSTRIASAGTPRAMRVLRGRRPPRSSGRPAALPPVTTRRGATPGEVQLDGVVEAGREDRRRAAVVLGRAQDDDGVGRALPRRAGPGPRSGTSRSRRPGRRRGRPRAASRSRSRTHRCRGPIAAGAGRGSGRVSGRGTSCTSRPSRTSTGRCGRSARRSACSRAGRRPDGRLPSRRSPSRSRPVAERTRGGAAGRRAAGGPRRGSSTRRAGRPGGDGRRRRRAGRRPRPPAARAPPRIAAAPRASDAATAGSAPSPGRRLAGDGHAEDRDGDAVADEAAQLLVQPNASRRNSLSGSCWA